MVLILALNKRKITENTRGLYRTVADDIKDIKTLHEMEQYSDIYDWARDKAQENDSFVGSGLNRDKAALVNKLHEYAQEIVKLDKDFKCVLRPIDTRHRHAGVQLQTGLGGYLTKDKRVLSLIAELHNTADLVGVSAFTDVIAFNFEVLDVWDKESTIYDKKK